ncbi:MAG: tetratricopeptide repeat protein [bacterium]
MSEWVASHVEGPYASIVADVQATWENKSKPYLPPTHDVDRLINRIHDSLRDQQWDLALDDANTAIALDSYAVAAHLLRARALDGKHDSWGAWTSTMVAKSYAFGDPLEDTQPFFELHQAKLGEREVTPIARQIALDFCMSLGEQAIVDEVRRMYLAHDTAGRASWLYLEVLSGAGLEALSELEPDSFMVMFHQAAQAARSGDGATAKALWQRWKDRPEFEEGSFDAFAANAYERVLYATPSLGSQFQALVSAASSEKDYDEVLAVTELWEELEPGDLASWTWRGIAYTFTQRPAEAIACYSKAIELHEAEIDNIYFGEHPISAAYFNRACERSRIAPVDEGAFEDLYHAVRLAARYADDARADDYMAAIWNDPRFEDAISRGLADGNQAASYEDYNDEFDA